MFAEREMQSRTPPPFPNVPILRPDSKCVCVCVMVEVSDFRY